MSGATIKLLQWNCMYSEDPATVASFIATTEADIICLQELTQGYHDASCNDSGEFIAKELGLHGYYDYGLMVMPDGSQAKMGMGIFSRFPIRTTQKIIIQAGRQENGRVIADERFYLEITLKVARANLSIGTTHLPFHPKFHSTPLKEQAMTQIIAHHGDAQSFILTGDFNTSPNTKVLKTLRSQGLKNAGPGLEHKTWTTKPFTIGSVHYEKLDWRLDYVLYKGVKPATRAKILPTDLSDHLPILAEFTI